MARFSFFALSLTALFAGTLEAADGDHNETAIPEEKGWNMDHFQEYWSRKVLIFSSGLDKMISGGLDKEKNVLSPENNQSGYPLSDTDKRFSKPVFRNEENRETYRTSAGFDDFFKEETYLDATNQSYVRVRGGYEYDRRGDSSFFYSVTARIKLPKTQEKLQLFIGDETEGTIDPSNAPRTGTNEGIGLKYYLPSLYGRLYTNASVGFSGIDDPYVKTHMEYPLFLGNWLFKTTQNFKYSVESKFDEWTSFYFDRKLSNKEMIRILLQRSTNTDVKGMEYLSQISYMNTLKHNIGFHYYLAANGRIKDLTGTFYDNGSTPQEGVYNYSAGMIWRQQLFSDYLFYQIEPILSFHEQYDYKPNTLLRLSIDLYFGHKNR